MHINTVSRIDKGKNFEFEHETWHGECLITIFLGCKVK